jgi:glycine/D-amino acid oxidase-like deaminating enzyme
MHSDAATGFHPLEASAICDVCVVGAGVAGLMTAYLLAREGRSVTVLEKGEVCGGETARSTAHLSFALDDRYYELERLFGECGARQAYESHARAIGIIEEIVRGEALDCEFTRLDGYLFGGDSGSDEELRREFEAAKRAGIGVEMCRTPATGTSLRFPDQGQLDPVRFTRRLAAAIQRLGGRICTGTQVAKVVGGSRPLVRTSSGLTVQAQAVVVATNSPIDDNLTIHARQAPYRTYAIAASVPWEAVPRALYWDTLDPYHYVRLKSAFTPDRAEGNDVLIVGGEDHRPGQSGDENGHFEALEQWTRQRFPIGLVVQRWSGMVFEPADRSGVYRARQCGAERLHCDGRFRAWHDARRHCRDAADGPDCGPREPVGGLVRSASRNSSGGFGLCRRQFGCGRESGEVAHAGRSVGQSGDRLGHWRGDSQRTGEACGLS